MKTFVFFAMLIFLLTSITHAGLDTYNCGCALIAAFRFESTKFNDEYQVTYTEDSGLQGHTGTLLNGAKLSNNGKFGKGLHLQGDDVFSSGTKIVPTLGNKEFSIAAWVKIPRQTESSLYFTVSGMKENGSISNAYGLLFLESGNLRALHTIGETQIFTETENQNVSDNKWHHIAYTKYLDTYYIFVDGDVTAETFQAIDPLLWLFGGDYTATLIGGLSEPLTGNVYIDDLVVLSIGLSPYEVTGLYENKIPKFMEAMPVSPQGRLTTTWGEIKFQR